MRMTLSFGRFAAIQRAAALWEDVASPVKLAPFAGTAPTTRQTANPKAASVAGRPKVPHRPNSRREAPVQHVTGEEAQRERQERQEGYDVEVEHHTAPPEQ